MDRKVSIIICAYNEEVTIEGVVRECHRFNKDAELIVVDDGSGDQTPEILNNLKNEMSFRIIKLEENKGKSHAMVTGVEHAAGEIILFFDADVTGIKKEHFDQLLIPLKSEQPEADMVLGSPSETMIDYRINPFKSLTGERSVFKKDLMPILEDIREIKFGVETYINLYYQAHGKRIKYTKLEGLRHPTTYGKTSTSEATKEYLEEGRQIADVYWNNYDLIIKRIKNSFEETNEKLKDSFKKMQDEMNDRIQVLLRNNG